MDELPKRLKGKEGDRVAREKPGAMPGTGGPGWVGLVAIPSGLLYPWFTSSGWKAAEFCNRYLRKKQIHVWSRMRGAVSHPRVLVER